VFSVRHNMCCLLEVQASCFGLMNSSVFRPLYKINIKNTVMTRQHKGMYFIKLVLTRQANLISQYKNINCKVLKCNTQIGMSLLYSWCLSSTEA
jgi:membrane protein CcdC involved in cytochrome C biogenesis